MDLVETISNAVVVIAAFLGAFLAALWLSMVIWTFRDIQARSRDVFAQILATLVVAILTLPGLVIYIMVRPRETLAEAYERSLEEEALLQSIEERDTCPGCGQRVDEDWILCPYCHTRLKKHCHHCGQTIQLPWTVCPYCGASDRPVSTPTAAPESTYAYPPGSALAQAAEAAHQPEPKEEGPVAVPAHDVDETVEAEIVSEDAVEGSVE
jgi:RNA polymerase subunit RPABC4/transcription elongation factor Spt4